MRRGEGRESEGRKEMKVWYSVCREKHLFIYFLLSFLSFSFFMCIFSSHLLHFHGVYVEAFFHFIIFF